MAVFANLSAGATQRLGAAALSAYSIQNEYKLLFFKCISILT